MIRILLALALLLSSCTCDFPCQKYRADDKEWYTQNGKLKVLSTTAMIDDIVETIGDGHVDTIRLIRGELDPHTYQMVKGDDEKLAYADVIFYNGLGLEHGPSLQKQLMENKDAIPLGDRIMEATPERILRYNGQLDPHIWMDISLWAETVPYIVETLSERDPAHAEEFRQNGAALAEKLNKAHETMRTSLQSIPNEKRYLVTSHDAFNYFAKAYLATDDEVRTDSWQKRFAAPEGLAPESQLSSRDIQLIIDFLKEHQIKVIFPESNVSRDSIRKIVQSGRNSGLDVTIATAYLYGDAMGEPGSDGDTYFKMMEHNNKVIKTYLNGESWPTKQP